MKYSLHLCFFTASVLGFASTNGQTTPFNTVDYIDINNIRAAQLVHGDMWWDPATGDPRCEFPKGSGKHVAFNAGVWMAGYDSQVQLKAAAQTYRSDGNDYWPGPVMGPQPSTHTEAQDWAKIWKLNRSSLDSFLSEPNHTIANTPATILTWPAKGNTFATGNNNVPLLITTDVAPFRDKNNNGVYEPLMGDYPEMKGDQMLWYVFNDNGPSHDQTGSMPLGVQVGFTAYAYKQNNVLDNIIFYEYNVTNKSGADLDSFVLGIWSDLDLGYGFDDFIGFDSIGSMGIAYNGDNIDGVIGPWSYGDSIPMAGIRVLLMPEDSCGSATPAGSFMYYNNSSDPIMGNPSNTVQFSNYLRSTWRNGQHLTNDFQGPGVSSNGTGVGPNASYVFSGSPNDLTQWSECASGNVPGDRRFVIGSQPLSFQSGSTLTFATALVVTPRKLNNGCPGADFSEIRNMSDSAQKIFCNPPVYTSVKETKAASRQLKLYPNPANSTIYIDAPAQADEQVVMFDGIGRRVRVVAVRRGNRLEMDIDAMTSGVYYITYRSGDQVVSNSFVKE